MGRQTTKSTDWAYIAGFLDGDGSLMVQIKKRSDTKRGIRLMFTICFYQDSKHEKPLKWIKSILSIGYISRRADKITELRINGYEQVKNILLAVKPYVKFKEKQVRLILKILSIINSKKIAELTQSQRINIAKLIIQVRNENYFSAHRKYSDKEIEKMLRF